MLAVQYKRRDVAALLLTAGANSDLQEEVRGAVGVCVCYREVVCVLLQHNYYHRLYSNAEPVVTTLQYTIM